MERNDTGLDGVGDANEFSGSTNEFSGTAPRTAGSAGGSSMGTPSSSEGLDDVSTTGTTGTTGTAGNGVKARIGVARDKAMEGLTAAKDWVKEKDIDAIKSGIEQQVKDHPGRTLLVAVGLGYLIGRAFRGGNSA